MEHNIDVRRSISLIVTPVRLVVLTMPVMFNKVSLMLIILDG
jgi:hypothetical protein